MKLKQLLEKLYELEQETNSILTIHIYDTLNEGSGLMSLVKEGGGFKVYIESAPDGEKDFIILFDKDNPNKDSYKYEVIYIDELPPDRIKIEYIQDLITLVPLLEINEFLVK